MKAVAIRAPSRLHFGMFSFGHSNRAQFGGVGVMVDPPAVEVRISPGSGLVVHGSMADRARKIIQSLTAKWDLPASPSIEVDVQAPPTHTGLGVGTQLSLAIAAGLRAYLQLPEMFAEDLALSVGRGLRSAVGTYGFAHGGLIVDTGKGASQPIGTLAKRAGLPRDWRFVLVRKLQGSGLAGSSEAIAFSKLAPVSEEITRELWSI